MFFFSFSLLDSGLVKIIQESDKRALEDSSKGLRVSSVLGI